MRTSLLISILLFSCALVNNGKIFNIKRISEIKPGITTKSQIIEMFGEPLSEQVHGYTKSFFYKYQEHQISDNNVDNFLCVDFSMLSKTDTVQTFRYFTKNGAELGTDFDPQLITNLIKDKSTDKDVLELFGEPTSKGSYSFNALMWTYEYSKFDYIPKNEFFDSKSIGLMEYYAKTKLKVHKLMQIYFNENKTVSLVNVTN